MRSAELRAAATRVGAIRALGLFAFLILAARAAHLTVIDKQGGALWDRQVYTRLELPAARGMIFDRRGSELAVTVNVPSVYAIGELTPKARHALARALGVSNETIDSRLSKRKGFAYISRWVSPAQAARVAQLGLQNVGLIAEPKRAYPAGSLAGRLLGFPNIDGIGVRGIEQREDSWLAGTPLTIRVERDGGGQLLADTQLRPTDAAGGDIKLTLDASLQAEAENALADAIAQTGARGGTIITVDPKSGDILALAEAPSFDPNSFRTTPYSKTGASAFDAMVEPGSTMKIFVAAAALESGAMTADEWMDTSGGEIDVPGKTIRDRRDFGELRLSGMLQYSSNVAAVIAAQATGAEAHYEILQRFGFGRPTGSRFPNESAGLVRDWHDWQPVDHATIAYGQGISTTVVQLAAATAALANDGIWRTPRLVLARRTPDGPWLTAPPSDSHRAVSAETARTVLEMMSDVVSADGTGRNANLAGLQVAGKTGTAQKLDSETRRYSNSRYIGWFVGAVPATDPRLVVTVALDEPRGIHSGGVVAAPVFARVASAQLAHLGIITNPEPLKPSSTPIVNVAITEKNEAPGPGAQATKIPPSPPVSAAPPVVARAPRRPPLAIERIGNRVIVPDFAGYSLAEVRLLTIAHALILESSGSGHAVSQEPAPGTILPSEQRSVLVRFGERGGGDG